jgi:Ca2+-binding RTX toxin-like protein
MAIFDFSNSGAGTSTLWANFGYLGSLMNSNTDFITRSATSFTADYGYSLVFKGTGSNLKYNSDLHHTLKSGTVNSFTVLSGGEPVIKLSGLGATVADLMTAFGEGASADDARDFFKELMSSADNIKGSKANDYLEGFDGNDMMAGNRGQDEMFGGKGSDTINGGLGSDTMNGGSGADHFRFNSTLSSSNIDYIKGFTTLDTIDLDNAIFKGIGAEGTTLSASKFTVWSAGDKLDADDRILYVKSAGDLYFDRDGSGNVYGAVKFAHVEGSPTISAADFLII